MSAVRMATPHDRQAILDLCRMLHEENGQHAYDAERVAALMDRCLCETSGIIGVVGTDMVAGFTVLLIDAVWFSDELHLLELANYVHPDHRRTDYETPEMGQGRQRSCLPSPVAEKSPSLAQRPSLTEKQPS